MTNSKHILELLKGDCNIEEILKEGKDETILYNFSSMRWNLLEWYPFSKEENLLQIGCGNGAMTELFAKKLKSVVNVTSDEVQAEVNCRRFSELKNVMVVQSTIDDLTLNENFDYVYMECGNDCAWKMLLENQNVDVLFKTAKKYLNAKGKLIVAMHNKLGISFLAGNKDIEEEQFYSNLNEKSLNRYFSKNEIENLLQEFGFEKECFYYPVPDYRLPQTIYSENYLPKAGDIRNTGYAYGQKRYQMFPEERVLDQLCDEGKFEDYANSFLVVAKSL